ncbi:hypothetical protein GCM10023349_04480 [Nocardioides conyzicola]|uniref:Uncharacterized protein n=1 Tax=Nocardioides conyzicola TaxID=1651781 RepID=A0ABP8WNZ5_9ACTN
MAGMVTCTGAGAFGAFSRAGAVVGAVVWRVDVDVDVVPLDVPGSVWGDWSAQMTRHRAPASASAAARTRQEVCDLVAGRPGVTTVDE